MSIHTIVRQHAEDASTKWWQRCAAVRQLDTRIEWLSDLDEQIYAHLDGLLEAGDAGLKTTQERHQNSLQRSAADIRGDSFILVLLETQRTGQSGLRAYSKHRELLGAIDDFLSWSPSGMSKQAILDWSQDPTALLHHCALRLLHIHGLNGDSALQQALLKSTTETVCTVLDAIAHCGRLDLIGHVFQLLDSPQFPHDSPLKFSAARCALLLGSVQRALAPLRQFAGGDTPYTLEACHLLSLVLPPEHFNGVLQTPNKALAVRCVGWHGNPAHVPWLLQQMQEASLRPLANESFRQIVGISVDTITASPPGNPIKHTSAESKINAVSRWWAARQKDFEQNASYLCGRAVTPDNLLHLLLTAPQGERDTAALRHLLMKPAAMRFPTAAHVDLQWQRAAAMAQIPSPRKAFL